MATYCRACVKYDIKEDYALDRKGCVAIASTFYLTAACVRAWGNLLGTSKLNYIAKTKPNKDNYQ